MLDPKCFREAITTTATHLKKRGFLLDVPLLSELEARRKRVQIEVQQLQKERKQYSKEIGLGKAQGEEVAPIISTMQKVSAKLAHKEKELAELLKKLNHSYATIPNLPHATVPPGKTEEDNLEIKRVGEPRKFTFTPKDHVELGSQLKMMDFASAAKITGARFVVLYDKLAKLQRILSRFMLDLHIKEHGYQEVYVPHIANAKSLFGTGQLPKLQEDLFPLTGTRAYYLIPTAEVPITNLVQDKILTAAELPLRYVTHTPCYRSEAGSYGKDLRGMIRQHQFEKVELVHIVKPQDSYQALEELLHNAENILQKLALPYRVVALCGGELGFAAAKTYDLEVWLPGQKRYREISSCSNLTDFQARRMQARFRNMESGKIELLHTLNGSGLAVGRTLIAIMENYQDANGHIHLPQVLWDYMDGEKVI